MTTKKKVYQLSDIGKSLQNMIETHYRSRFWIKAEISKLNYYPKTGHCFPDLVERNEGKIKAQMKAIIWATHYQKISEDFLQIAKSPLEDGMQILFKAKVTYHQTYGFSLQILNVDPSFTLGELAVEKEKCIQQLKKQNLYFANKQLTSPLLIKRLAIISYNTSKGYADFLSIIQQYKEKYNLHYQLFPSLLQGDKAEKQLVNQLQLIEKKSAFFDAVCIIRGGGGEVGMNCYNSYEVSVAIATIGLPVYTGIGHATNETVCEMIAHKNCITPTDLAYEVIQKFKDYELRIQTAQNEINTLGFNFIQLKKQKLLQASVGLQKETKNLVRFQHQILQQQKTKVKLQPLKLIQKSVLHLKQIQSGVKRQPIFKVKVAKKELDHQNHLLQIFISNYFTVQKQALSHQTTRLKYLSPESVLQRGYSLILKEGKIVTDIQHLKEGDRIENRTKAGIITSKIKQIAINEKNEIQ